MKIVWGVLLVWFISLLPCVKQAATFVVNVTQSSYQGVKNHSITLEWTFPTKTQGSYRDLSVICSLLAPDGDKVLYHVSDGAEISKFQDKQFSGRVQSDKDVLREGRIRLHVSRLRTEDSGPYVCEVETEDGFNSAECRLKVSGQVKVVGHEPIHKKVGDDVILPCHLEPPFDVSKLTIEWRFQSLHSNESDASDPIHVYRSGAKDNEASDPNFKNRTSLFYDEIEKGNISLKLTNVTKKDGGNYTCCVPKLESQVKKGKVTLKVDENGPEGKLTHPGDENGENKNGIHPGVIGAIVVGVVGGVALLISIIIFIIYYVKRHCRGQQNRRRRDPGEEGEEEEAVQLQNLEQPN